MNLFDIRQKLLSGVALRELPLRVTFYARVSTGKDEQLHSLSAQVEYYRRCISENPAWTYVEGYVDEGLSGTEVTKRDSFLRMMQDARQGAFDFILTKEISRFSRNTLDSLSYTRSLLEWGVGVFFESDGINTLFPDAELRLTILSSIAQDEVRKLSERVRFGFKRAIENGVVLGSGNIWGYKKEEGRLIIDEEQAAVVRRIFSLYAEEGLGIRAVADRLTGEGIRNSAGRPFCYSTVRSILANPKYKGFYCGGKTKKYDYKCAAVLKVEPQNWVTYPDGERVPPIVSPELWERANAILAGRSGKAPEKRPPVGRFSYTGRIICPIHNVSFYRNSYHTAGGEREVWQCREYAAKGKKGCASPVIYTEEMDRLLLSCLPLDSRELLCTAKEALPFYSAGRRQEAARQEGEKKRLAETDQIRQRMDKLLDLSIKGLISDEEFALRNRALGERLSALEEQASPPPQPEGDGEKLLSFVEGGGLLAKGPDAPLVEALLDRAEVFPGEGRGELLVRLFLKGAKAPALFRIIRQRGKPSLCCRQYT